jgi:hypothetical protein
MGEFRFPSQFTIEELRDWVAGKNLAVPRTKAISLLSVSDVPDKHMDLKLLLENKNEPSTIRYLAASGLGRMNTAEARIILAENIQNEVDERVAGSILTALGRIGDANSLSSILNVKGRLTGSALSRAEFAASLISYRLGLEGNNLPLPSGQDYLAIPDDAQQMIVSEADDKEIKLCIESLIYEPFGIEIAKKPAYQINYDKGVGIVLFNRETASQEGVNLILERKTFLGLFADKMEESGSYSVSYLIFTSPGGPSNQIDIVITNPAGVLVCGGTAKIEPNKIEFSIRSVSQLGIFPLIIEGLFRDGELEITTAKFSTIIQNSKEPPMVNIHSHN